MDNIITFLRTVLSDEGYICLSGINESGIRNFYYESVEAPLNRIAELEAEGFNVYVTPGTFTKRRRKTSFTKHVKSFFLDIDCGHGKVSYPTQAEGLQALKDFCKKLELPKPNVIVNSGRGLHVYWVLTEALEYSKWKPIAERLKRACKIHGFKVDPSVPADSARLLRVPCTTNFNSDPPVPVALMGRTGIGEPITLDAFASRLNDIDIIGYRELDTSRLPKPVSEQILGSTYAEKSFKKLIRLTKRGKGCKQIAYSLTNPNDLSYAQWLHLLSIIKFCDDTDREALHRASKGYEFYNEEETDKVSESLLYPHTCRSFCDDHEAGCKGCPHKGNIASPIILAMKIKVAEDNEDVKVKKGADPFDLAPGDVEVQNIPDYPWPYFRKEGGGVWLHKKEAGDDEDDAKDVMILPTDLYFTRRVRDPVNGPCLVLKHHTHREGVQEFVLSSVALSTSRECGLAMCKNGVHVTANEATSMVNYSKAWINKLAKEVDEEEACMQFGWDDKFTSFTVGKYTITKDTILDNPPSAFTHQYFPFFEPLGTLDGYKEMLTYFDLPGLETHQFMIGLAFGAPLMAFAPDAHGCVYNLFTSKSGYGKSTCQHAGAGVWGNPSDLVLPGQSTANSIWTRTQLFRNIAIYIDEMTNNESKMLSGFAYDVAQGQQKSRLTNTGQNQERYKGKVWNLLVGTSANTNMAQKIQEFRHTPAGESQRLFEAEATLQMGDVGRGLTLNRLIASNYGHAGKVYIQRILQDISHYGGHDKYGEMVDSKIKEMAKISGTNAGNRYWNAAAATTLLGLEVAKDLGLHNWDLEKLQDWSVTQIKKLSDVQKASELDIKELIAEYYYANLDSVIELRSDQTGTVRIDRIPRQLIMRREPDTNVLYMVRSAFRRFATERNLIMTSLETLMEENMGMYRKQVRLARNTNLDFSPQHCYVVTYTEDELAKNVERARDEYQVKNNPDFTHRS